MADKFLEEMKTLLRSLREEIVQNLATNNDDFKSIVSENDPKDFGDIVTANTDRDMLQFMGEKELKRMQQIESALIRIEQNKYGRCIRCRQKIPETRLRAIPYALMCIECQSAKEKQKR